jgi:hypothetical protein
LKTDASLALDIAQRMTYRQVYYRIDPKSRVDPDCLLGNDSTLNRPTASKKQAAAITLLTQVNFLRRDHTGHYTFAQPAMIGLLAALMWRKILLDDGLSALSTKPRFYGAIALSAPVLDDLTLILLFERIWNQHFLALEFAWMRAHILEEQSKVIYSKTTAQVLGWCVASLSPIAQQCARDLIRVVAGLLLFEVRSDILRPMLAPAAFYESLLLLKAIAVEELTLLLDEMAKLVRTGIADRSRFNRAQALLDADLPFIFSKRWLITTGLMQTQNNLGHEIRQRLTQISQQIRQHEEQHKKRGIFAA